MAKQVPSFKDYTYFSVKNVPVKDLQYKSHIYAHTILKCIEKRGMICTHFPLTCFLPLVIWVHQWPYYQTSGGFGTSILQELISLKYKQL